MIKISAEFIVTQWNRSSDLEVEPPRQETFLGHNADDGVETFGVVRDDLQKLATARLLAVSREHDVGVSGVRVQHHIGYGDSTGKNKYTQHCTS